jgi:TonB family protein
MRGAGLVLLILIGLHSRVSAQAANQTPPSGANVAGGRVVPTVDVPGFCCPDYLALIADRIGANWNDRGSGAGTTVLRATIQRDGRIADSAVETSSGDTVLDVAAQRALAVTRELPALPAAYPNQALTIHLNFRRTETVDNPGGAGGQSSPVIQFDTRGVDFRPWLGRFMAQVKRNWFLPYAAMSMKGQTVVTFYVHKDGSITDITVTGPSPIEQFNTAAFGALSGSSPTQPLPLEYPSEKAFFTVTFFYNELPPRIPLPDEPGSSLLKASAVDVEQRIGKPSRVDGHRWTYTTTRGALLVYFDDAQVVIDVQPRSFDLSIFKK